MSEAPGEYKAAPGVASGQRETREEALPARLEFEEWCRWKRTPEDFGCICLWGLFKTAFDAGRAHEKRCADASKT
jgi:hypothetical protein